MFHNLPYTVLTSNYTIEGGSFYNPLSLYMFVTQTITKLKCCEHIHNCYANFGFQISVALQLLVVIITLHRIL